MTRIWAGLLILLAAAAALPAAAQERVALVIGNAAYAHTSPLKNPLNDARAIARRLEALGFAVTRTTDADRRAMAAALRRFADAAEGADTALIFYSGHGMEAAGRNFLIPIDARLAREDDAELEAIALESAIAAASRASRLSVVIVDACRNNRFPSNQRSGAKGFAAVGARPGQVIAFSTAPGRAAYDGDGDLSPFTQALSEALEEAAEEDVRILFTSLGEATARYAGAEQRPFTRIGDMTRGRVSLAAGAGAARASAPAQIAAAPPPAPPLSTRLPTRAEVLEAQTILKKFGYYKGAIDGGWGRESRRALADFNKARGLGDDDALTAITLDALRVAARGAATHTESTAASEVEASILQPGVLYDGVGPNLEIFLMRQDGRITGSILVNSQAETLPNMEFSLVQTPSGEFKIMSQSSAHGVALRRIDGRFPSVTLDVAHEGRSLREALTLRRSDFLQ